MCAETGAAAAKPPISGFESWGFTFFSLLLRLLLPVQAYSCSIKDSWEIFFFFFGNFQGVINLSHSSIVSVSLKLSGFKNNNFLQRRVTSSYACQPPGLCVHSYNDTTAASTHTLSTSHTNEINLISHKRLRLELSSLPPPTRCLSWARLVLRSKSNTSSQTLNNLSKYEGREGSSREVCEWEEHPKWSWMLMKHGFYWRQRQRQAITHSLWVLVVFISIVLSGWFDKINQCCRFATQQYVCNMLITGWLLF